MGGDLWAAHNNSAYDHTMYRVSPKMLEKYSAVYVIELQFHKMFLYQFGSW